MAVGGPRRAQDRSCIRVLCISLSLSIYLEVPESTSRNHVLASGDKPCTNKTRKNLNRPSSYIILNSKTTTSSFTRRPPCHYTVHPTLSQDLA